MTDRIKDEWGNEVFSAKNHVFSFGHKLDFIDLRTGQQIAYIEQKVLTLMPKYTIYLGNTRYAEMKQKFTWLSPKFEVHTNDGLVIIKGNWTDFEYTFERNGQIIATASRKIFTIRDTYCVTIQPGEDVIFILSCCFIIEKVSEDKRRQRSNNNTITFSSS